MEGLGSTSQALTGKIGGVPWSFADGLARDEGEWIIGLYRDPTYEGFAPTSSYIEIHVPAAGEYRIGDSNFSAIFKVCPADTPAGGCVGSTAQSSSASSGGVEILQTEEGGAIRIDGSVLLVDREGSQVDGVFTPIPLYEPLCARNSRRCEANVVQRCRWDQRVWAPELSCDGEQACGAAVEQCSDGPESCLLELGCVTLL
jgi:hypothetical protein